MSYCFTKKLNLMDFQQAVELVTEQLKNKGFGVISQIDVQNILKTKINAEMHKYVILGACHPQHAYYAIQKERNIGVFLPCNLIVVELENGDIEVSAVDPVSAMASVNNPELAETSVQIREQLISVIESL
jgi:uncharacterized protein (DUF302 family)